MNALSVENQNIDTEYVILENIYDSSRQQIALRQRELAHIAGASLGMTNSILKRLAQKGWITVKRLNSRNIQYAITLEGINEIVHRSYRYFKRTIRNVVYFKDILEDTIYGAGRRNIGSVYLIGASDLDFIVEHICRRRGLNYSKIPETEKAGEAQLSNALKIYAEGIPEPAAEARAAGYPSPQNVFYLSRLIIKQAAGAELGLYEA